MFKDVATPDEERVPLNPSEEDGGTGSVTNSLVRPPEMDIGTSSKATETPAGSIRDLYKLIFGAGGIYVAFIYYGSLQEDVFNFKAPNGTTFQFAWFLQFLEALANILVGYLGRKLVGGTDGLPLRQFYVSGATQVCSKAFTSLALAKGLSFPVATLAKSGKMAPVMAGQLLLGGASYTIREYLQVAAIIGGTAILSLGKKKAGGAPSSPLGVFFIVLSLIMDGVTGGVQKRLKADTSRAGLTPKPYDFMLYTNISMCLVALFLSVILGEMWTGYQFCAENPAILSLVIHFSICSAVGQSFIFYTVAHFDPLVCSTVTTTRKIFSVLLSILLKGHAMSAQGWAGVTIACGGILSEVHAKVSKARKLKSKVSM